MAQGLERIPLAVDSDFQAQPVRANFPDAPAQDFKLVSFEPDQVQAQPAPQPRSLGTVAADTAYGMAKGAGSLAKGIGWLTGSDGLQQAGQDAEDYWGEKQSADLHRQLEAVGKAEGVSGTVASLWNNPGAIGDYIATSLPMMIPGMAVGNLGARGIIAYAGNAARGAALRAGATEAAAMQAGRIAAEKAAEKAAMRFAVGANMLGEGSVSGGVTGAEVEKFALEHGATPEQAKAAANKSALMAGAWTTAGAGIGAGMETRAMLGRLKDSGIKGMVKNVAKEAAEEAIQNPGEDYAAYAGKVQFDPTQTFDPGKAATLGAVTGGAMGAGFHAAGRAGTIMRGEGDGDNTDGAIPAGDVGAGPGSGGPGAIEGTVLGPEQIADQRGGPITTRQPETYTQITPTALPRLALPAPEAGGPSDRQVSTAIGLLKHSPKASPELLQRLMRVDQTMATMLFNHWKANGQVTGNQATEIPAPGDQGQGADIAGSRVVGGFSDGAVSFTPGAAAEGTAPGGKSGMAMGATGPDAVTPLDVQAHAAATSPFNATPQPTEAQKQAGNYAKGHVKFQGMDIAIENPAGSVRSGKDADGKAWENTLAHHYGYIKGSTAKDGDQVDVFIKPGAQTARMAYVIDQIDPKTGKYDEAKVVLGADSEADAKAIYHANYQEGWQGFGAMTAMPMDEFKAWVKSGKTKKPLAYVEPKGVSHEKPVPKAKAPVAIDPSAPYGKVGVAPFSSQVVGLKDNGDGTATVMRGEEPFYDFENGDPVTVPTGATAGQIRQTVADAGALSSRDKWFGVAKAETKPAETGTEPTIPPEQDPAADVDFLASIRAEFRHEGFRIYPISIKGEARWAVQSLDNAEKEQKGERQIGGDAIVDTAEQAKKQAEDQVTERAEKAERQREFAKQDAANEAKKEANRGLSITERRANAALDKPTNLPVNAGVGRGSRREAMESAVSQGRAIVAADVPDTAAYKRDEDEQGRLHRAGYGAFFGNNSHPQKMRFNELTAKLKNRDNYQKKEYRLYSGRDTDGGFYEITKTEYDYAKSLMANGGNAKPVAAIAGKPVSDMPAEQLQKIASGESKTFGPAAVEKASAELARRDEVDSPKESKEPWQYGELEFGDKYIDETVLPDLRKQLANAHGGKFQEYPSKAAAVRGLKERIDTLENHRDAKARKYYASLDNHYGAVRAALADGKPVPPVAYESYEDLKADIGSGRIKGDGQEVARVEQPQHIEAGQAEPATAPVIAASLKESAKNTPMNIEQAREWLLSEIDKAIIDAKSAKEEGIWNRADDKVNLEGIMDVGATIGFKTFNVPGDGKFRVLNLKESLQKFKKQVAASPGFKKNATRPMSLASGNGGKTSVRDLLDDGEYVLAADYGHLTGKPLLFGSVREGEAHPIAYTDAEPIDIKGINAQVGREWNATGKSLSWRVIETTTGLSVASESTKEKAISKALAHVDEHGTDKLKAIIAESQKVSQAELERQFTDWGSEEEAKAQKQRDAVERSDSEDRALWNSIWPLSDGEKRSPNPWNDIDHLQVVILAQDAAKVGKADEFVSLIERRRGGTNNVLALAARKALADAAPKAKPSKGAVTTGVASKILGDIYQRAAYNKWTWDRLKSYLTRELEEAGVGKSRMANALEKAMTEYARTANGRLGYPNSNLVFSAMRDYGLITEDAPDAQQKPGVDYKGFERTPTGNGNFTLKDGNLLVKVEAMGSGKFQASHGSAKSSPHINSEQGAVDWAANLRDASKKTTAYPFYSNNKLFNAEGTAELPKDWTGVARSDSGKRFFYLGQENGERSFNPLKAESYEDALKEAEGLKNDKPVVPDGYREVARGYFGGTVEKPIYAPFAEGDRVRFIGGHAGNIQSFIGGPVTTGAIIKYDNGLTGRAEWRDVEAVKKPSAEQEPKNFKSIDTLNAANNPLGEDDWIRFADGSEWQVKGRMNGWALVQGKTEHPTVKNIMGQVPFIRAVVDANDAAQATKGAEDTALTVKYGGSELDIDLGNPAYQATMDDVEAAVRAKGYSADTNPRTKYDPMQMWRHAHATAVAKAAKDGKPIPARVLYDYRGLIRDDLNDEQADIAADKMVEVFRDTKDYEKAVQAYRDFGRSSETAPPASIAGKPVSEMSDDQLRTIARGLSPTFGEAAVDKAKTELRRRDQAAKPARPYATPDDRNEAIYTLQRAAKDAGLEYSDKAIKDAAEFGASQAEIAAAIEAGEDAVSELASRYAERSNGLRQGFGQGNNDAALRAKPMSERDQRIASLTGRGLYELPEDQRSSLLKAAKVRSVDAFEDIAISDRREIIGRWIDAQPKENKVGAGETAMVAGYPVSGMGDKALAAHAQSSNAADRAAAMAEIERRKATVKDSLTPEKAEQQAEGKIDTHESLFDRLRDGTATLDEFKAGFVAVVAGKEAITAELSKLTKDAIFKRFPGLAYRYKTANKAEIVDAAYRDMASDFALGRSISYVLGFGGDGGYFKAITAMVERTTDADLAEYAEHVKSMRAAQTERVAQVKAAMKDPKTLDDFEMYLRAKMAEGDLTLGAARMTMTPEQRVAFDELASEKSRAERKARGDQQRADIRVAAATTEGQIIETKHTKTGEPLFVVKAAERVERDVYNHWNATAKKLGGWYSSYRGGGAVPGFQFKTRENADAFLAFIGGNVEQAKEAVQTRRDAFEDDRSQTAVERLTEMADRLEERADESLNRDRKENTDRRARMAASAEAAANSDKSLAKTMRNIAQAIESGKTKFLDRVRQKAQVEMLRGFLHTAKANELRAKFPSYADQEKHRGAAPTAETADYVDFPRYTAFRSDLATMGRQMLDIDGAKKTGAALLKVADDVSAAYLAFAKEHLHQVSTFKKKDSAPAIFASRDDAETAIKRSGFKGKAVVLPFKRGQNIIIMSPSAAKEAGIWKGDDDKRITLSPDFGEEVVAKVKEFSSHRISMPYLFENVRAERSKLKAIGIETPAELRSALREFMDLRAAPPEVDKIKQMERAMIGRKNDGLDFFPTPASVADELVQAAGIEEGMAVLEPSAGMGHIAERIRAAGVDPDVVEMASDRRELLEAKGFRLVSSDFMDMTPRDFTYGDVFRAPDGTLGVMRGSGGLGSNRVGLDPLDANGQPEPRRMGWYDRDELEGVEKRAGNSGYDRIIMNPPFSDRRDAQHVQHAYTLLKPGGRLVAIMGEGVFFGQDKKAQAFRDWLEEVGGTSEKLEEGTFLDPSLPVNTGVNARMVVVEKPDGATSFSIRPNGDDAVAAVVMDDMAAQKIIDGFRSNFPGANKMVAVPDFAALPAHVQQDARDQGGNEKNTKGVFDHRTGTIYIVAGNHTSEADVQETVFHEALGHLGIRTLLGKEFVGELNSLFDSFGGLEGLAKIAKDRGFGKEFASYVKGVAQARQKNPRAFTTLIAKAVLAEEVFAHAAQHKPALIDRLKMLVGKLREALRKYGLAKLAEYGETDLLWMLQKAQVRLRTGQADGRGGWTVLMTAYHGTRSAVSPAPTLGPVDTASDAFKRWFGDSKVVDAEGKPLVVYHGTLADFAEFDQSRLGGNTRHPTSRLGFWFSSSPDVADLFTQQVDESVWPPKLQQRQNANTMPVYLAIRNPFILTVEKFREINGRPFGEEFENEQPLAAEKMRQWIDANKASLVTKGYDGIKVEGDPKYAESLGGEEYAADAWVAFRPEQIKSAISNAGSFSGTVITESRSRSTGFAPTESTRAIQSIVDKFLKQFAGAADLDIRVVRTVADIPERFRPSPFAEGTFNDDAGLIYLVAMNLKHANGQVNTGRVWQVLMHEAVGHFGLAKMMGPRFNGILKQVQQAAKAKGDVAEDIYQPGHPDYATVEAVRLRYPEANDSEVAQEVLARIAETDPGRTLFGYVRAVVRQWLRDMARAAGITLDVTTAELNDLVAQASRYMRRGDGVAQGVDVDALGVADMAVGGMASKATGMESRAAPTAGQPQEPRTGILDTILRKAGGELAAKITGPAYDKLTAFLGGKVPEGIKAGTVSDYGLDESYVDRRTGMQTAQQKAARQTKTFVEGLMELDRAQSRVAYQWLNNRGAEADRLMAQLPPESQQVLKDIKIQIAKLTIEAVRLGQLDAETASRNFLAYLHRSYAKYDLNTDDKTWKAERAKAIKILGDQYKGRGLKMDVDPDRIHSAPGWWQDEMKGKRVQVLKNDAGRFAFVAEGTAIPPNLSGYKVEGVWEIRARKAADRITLWRDFTQDERQMMGELDEAKYAVARTLFMMNRDIEVGRFHEWVADEYAKTPEEAEEEGLQMADASDSMMRAFTPDEWVTVPTSKIPGTGVFKYGALAGMVVPGPVWNDIRQISAGRFEPFGAAYASILRAWKLSKTALTPTTHVNNIMGNFVMADMHDVGARDAIAAVRLMVAAANGDKDAKAMLDRFEDSGATQGMFTTHELKKEVLEPLLQQLREEVGMADDEAAILKASAIMSLALHGQFGEAWAGAKAAAKQSTAGRVTGAVVTKAQDYYQAEDSVFRLAAFLKSVDEGKTDLEAGKLARKAFLDYHINAPWINAMRGTAMPFIAFAYRAIPMLTETAAKKPWKIAKYMLVAGGLNALAYAMLGADADEDKERAYLPEEKAGRLWGIVPKLIRMPWNRESKLRDGKTTSDPVFLDVRRWIPVGDVVDYGQDKTALPMIPQPLIPGGPLIMAAEFLVNKSAFTGKELTKETDTWVEKAAKVGGHFYKGFMPNVPIPYSGTWAGTKIDNAVKGKEDPLGRAYPVPEAIASGFGLKLERYPVDTLQRNAVLDMKGKLRELSDAQRQAARDYGRQGMTKRELDEKVTEIVGKKNATIEEYKVKERKAMGR